MVDWFSSPPLKGLEGKDTTGQRTWLEEGARGVSFNELVRGLKH